MKWRKFHELTPWDERTIFRLRQGAKMRGNHATEDWRTILAEHRSPPPPPALQVTLRDDAIELMPPDGTDQLQLGAVRDTLIHWTISNARDVYELSLPFRLFSLIGVDAFTKRNSWRRRIYSAPVILRRDDQRYPKGWDGLHAALAKQAARAYPAGEIAKLGDHAIAATLTGQEAHDFWRANR